MPAIFIPCASNSRFCVLQLDQLPFAVRSPVGGTEKQENGSLWSFQCFQALYASQLVASGKIGGFLSYCQANFRMHPPQRSQVDGIAVERSRGGHTISQVALRLVLRIEKIHLPGRVVIQHLIWYPEHPLRCTWLLQQMLRPHCNCR